MTTGHYFSPEEFSVWMSSAQIYKDNSSHFAAHIARCAYRSAVERERSRGINPTLEQNVNEIASQLKELQDRVQPVLDLHSLLTNALK